jgi:uncharacterized membrane protein
MNDDRDPIEAYRQRLEAASGGLAPEVRADLLEDVDGHLDEIRRTATTSAEIRGALDRLGSPEAIAATAASEQGGSIAAPPATPPLDAPPVEGGGTSMSGGLRVRDVLAVVMVVFGTLAGILLFLPIPPLMPLGAFAGFVTGLVLLWTSRVWTAREKLLATLVWPGGVVLPLGLGTISTQTCVIDGASEVCTGFALPPIVGIPVAIAVVAAPIVVGGVLLARAHRRSGI